MNTPPPDTLPPSSTSHRRQVARWQRGGGVVLLLVITVVVIARVIAHPAPKHPFFAHMTNHPIVIAHRGGKGLFPEETLYAFEQSVAMGVDALECDIHLSADGELVLLHDDTVDRTTNGSGAVADMTLAELRTLDAGYQWTTDDGVTYPYRGRGIGIATLQDVLQAFPTMSFVIELKGNDTAIVAPFCALVQAHHAEERILVASFSPDIMHAVQRDCPAMARSGGEQEIRTFFALATLGGESLFTPTSLAYQVPEYSGSLHVITPRFLTAARNRTVAVYAWTINEPTDIQRMIDVGVDGIITDYPDRVLQQRVQLP